MESQNQQTLLIVLAVVLLLGSAAFLYVNNTSNNTTNNSTQNQEEAMDEVMMEEEQQQNSMENESMENEETTNDDSMEEDTTMEAEGSMQNENTQMEAEGEAMMEDENNQVTVELIGTNYDYDQETIEVNQGDTVTLKLTSNEGFHDVVVDQFNASSQRVNQGETTEVTFVADQAGEFPFYCSVGNHRQLGMEGTLVVNE